MLTHKFVVCLNAWFTADHHTFAVYSNLYDLFRVSSPLLHRMATVPSLLQLASFSPISQEANWRQFTEDWCSVYEFISCHSFNFTYCHTLTFLSNEHDPIRSPNLGWAQHIFHIGPSCLYSLLLLLLIVFSLIFISNYA